MKKYTLGIFVFATFVFSSCSDNSDTSREDSGSTQTGVVGKVQSGEDIDFILTNGKVRTGDTWAESVAIADGHIVAVGNAGEIEAMAGAQTNLIDLEGHVVLPGFRDNHVHPLYGGITFAGLVQSQCLVERGATLERLRESLKSCVDAVDLGDWITGRQWNASSIGQIPNRSMIDDISPDNPVLLYDTSGHSALVNSKALQIADVTADTKDPEGGIIERNERGEPSGVLRETALGLVGKFIPPPSQEEVTASLKWAAEKMLSFGITSFTEASLGFTAGEARELKAYTTLAADGLLKQRVRICINWAPGLPIERVIIRERAQYEQDRLSLDCVKIFLDGVPTDSHTAAMLEPYADVVEGRESDASRYGILFVDQKTLSDAVTKFDKMGLTVKFHAAGDAAVRAGLNAIEAARKANGPDGGNHNVGHCTFVAREDIHRALPINATFEVSPYLWSPSPTTDDITKAIGEERIKRVWPIRDIIESGAPIVPGSDWPVVPTVNPWIAIEALVTREAPGGSKNSFGKGQAITVEQAIDLFTINSAKHMNAEDRLGAIKPGMLADIIVIDRDPYTSPVNSLHDTQVLMTFVEGEMVFDSTMKR